MDFYADVAMGCLQEAAASGKINLLFMLNTEVNIDKQSTFHCVNDTGGIR